MSDRTQDLYESVCRHGRELALLGATESMLGWDERTMMPKAGAEYRAEQMALLAGIIHRRRTDTKLGEALEELSDSKLAADPHSDSGTTIRQLKREFDKRSKLPQLLVEELTRTASIGQHIWQEARASDDFGLLRATLEKTVHLKRQQAEALGYPQVPYDALLDDFEPGELTSNVAKVLGGLRDALVPLVSAVMGSSRRPDVSILKRHYPSETQQWFGREVAARLGFDFLRGRLDVTAHPFCSSLGPHDCRITTRYDDHYFPTAFFGTLHEAGHGIYDQGLRAELYGLPPGEAVSLGIHESQSRLWENLVGRSLPFWKFFYPNAQQMFPAALSEIDLDDFYFAVNSVEPSLIRVEADEATYNLHILVRFELEQALVNDELSVAELQEAWQQKYETYLNIRPTSDADGVLQDIHWSAGLIGYFPTYSLGNLYAAQFFKSASAELGNLPEQFAEGRFAELRDWLRTRVYESGQRFTPRELVMRITGQPLAHAPLIEHLRGKLEPLYRQ